MNPLLQEIQQAMAEVRRHRQTIVCHRDRQHELQAALDRHPAGGLVALQASDLVPANQVYIFRDSLLQPPTV